MKRMILALAALGCLTACNKVADSVVNKALATPSTPGVTEYTIRKGQQFCDGNTFKEVQVSDLKFTARFDSTAVYQTQNPVNQYDINKLYGFSDNNQDHHQYSARIGWCWSDGALHLFGYIYNAGTMSSKEITTVPIGPDIPCEIRVADSLYIFNVNGKTVKMPRLSKTPLGSGYQLYPYFGGEETAPHDVHVWIGAGNEK